jgi:hypothetical protein
VWSRLLVSCEEGEEEEERGGAPEDRRLTYYCGTRGDRERRIARNQNRGRLIQVLSLLLSISKSICLVFLLSFDVIFELGFGHFGGSITGLDSGVGFWRGCAVKIVIHVELQTP